MARPICGHCGTPYGQRTLEREVVRWDTPSKSTGIERHDLGGSINAFLFMADGDIVAPPPYLGNGIVVKESSPHVNATDGRAYMERQIWDGDSYFGGYKPFCTLRCALDYARRAFFAKAKGK